MLHKLGGTFALPSIAAAPTSENSIGNKYPQYFLTAVVKDFFYDPASLTGTEKDALKGVVKLSSSVDNMPINSVHCIIIESSHREEIIAYPFFSQHLCVPVKPGEQVWVIRERNLCYWICRKTSNYTVDDVNYTHMDRVVNSVASSNSKSAIESFEGLNSAAEQFPGGKSSIKTESSIGADNSYESIVQESSAYKYQFIPEPVPRIVKKPGDFVLQGSNNATIVLGNDGNDKESGSIDIVAGRQIKSDTLENTRAYQEIDKSKPATEDGPRNFVSDLSRIYATMKGDVDVSFDINIDGVQGSGESPAVVLKSDQLRLVARKDIKITVGDTGAGIVLKASGEIVIVPSATSVIKLGGEDANKAILCQDIIPGTDGLGNVQAPPVVSTMGGVIGSAAIAGTGLFASKVLVK
jgi:hypothetical protein